MDMTTEPTPEAATITTRERAPVGRFYVSNGHLIRREKNGPTITLLDLDDPRLDSRTILTSLAVEGIVALLTRSDITISDILSGVLPDRSPPAEKSAKTREPTLLQRAIATIRERALTRATKDRGEKVDKAVIGAEAMAQVRALSAERLKEAGKIAEVQVELARLRGSSGSLDALFAAKEEAST